jgi:histidinol-phosphate aminotransferase
MNFGPDYVRAIAPYLGGKPISEVAREFGLDEAQIIKLASNENPLGIPESAKRAMSAAMADLARYPDSNGFELKATISAKFDVPSEWITLGNGSNDILELAARSLVSPRQSVVYSQYSFAVYSLATQAIGARAIVVPAKDFGHDLPAMRAAITDDTRLIFLANPNNPTGTFIDGEEIEAFIRSVPSHIVIVLDEAYTEYLSSSQHYDAFGWVAHHPNLIVSRSFSKAYGLAGLRIGFGIAQPGLTDLMNRLRQPFNVNSLAQAAAIAALHDEAFLQKSAEINAQGYRQLTTAFDQLDINFVPSVGNFVLFRAGEDENAGAKVNLALLKRGIIVRPVGNYGLPQWLRVSIGLPQENEAFIAALKFVLA